MATIGKLSVQITADSSGLTQGLKTATTATDNASAQIVSSVKAIGAAFATYLSADLFVGMIRGAADAGRQIDQLSKLSATSTQVFQQQAYAAQQFGISNEKLADIFKDVQDKIGDFMQTGAGPLADFFEKIAPRVGVTADQFRKLGGPDALQLYVSSLERANLTQSEMTFYLEAIASDSSMLLPLLRDNGKAMKELGDEAQRLGAVLDEETIKANREFAQQLDQLQSLSNTLSVTIGSALIPELNRLITEFVTGIKVAGGFWDALKLFGTARPFDSPAEGARHYSQQLASLVQQREALINAEGVMANTSGFDREIEQVGKLMQYYRTLVAERANVAASAGNQSEAEARRLGLSAPVSSGTTPPPARAAGGKAAAEPQKTDALDEWFEQNQKRQDQQDERERQYWADRVARVQEGLLSESELLQQKYKQDLERLNAATMTEDERRVAREALELEHLTRMGEIEAEGHALRVKAEQEAASQIEAIRKANMTNLEKFTAMSYQDQAKAVANAMTQQLTSVNTTSRAMFNIQKAASISQAIMDTYAGANRALKDYPAPWSYAVAGATMAAGLSRVASIRSQSFGGGAASMGSGASGGGVAAANGMAAQQGGATGMGGQTITIQGVGAGDLFSGDAVRTLIDRLIDAQRNGARIVLA